MNLYSAVCPICGKINQNLLLEETEGTKEFSNLIMQEIKKMHVQFEYEINHHTEFRKIVQEELKEFRHDLHNMETRMASIERK